MDMATQIQILNQAVSISHSTNTLGICINPIILPPVMGKVVGQTDTLALVWKPV